jgi:outer membrane protein TolC
VRQTLILGDLYSEVKHASPRIQAAQATARAAEARVAGARVPPDPQLQLAFMNYSPTNLRPMDPVGMPQLQVMQMIPIAGKLSLAGRVAQTQSDAAWSRAAAAEWEQRTKVARVFYELYATDRQLAIAKETRRLLEDIASIARSMYEVGEGRQADVFARAGGDRAHVRGHHAHGCDASRRGRPTERAAQSRSGNRGRIALAAADAR